MNLERIKREIDAAAEKYRSLGEAQRFVTAAGGAGLGAILGSVSLGKDSSGRKRGYLLGGDKGRSRTIGALAGAMAGLHVPTLK